MKNYFGSPIFKSGNRECKYFIEESTKRNEATKFSICTCPIRINYLRENNHSMIINCSQVHEECPIFMAQDEHDIKWIRAYIKKYDDDGTLKISSKHWERIISEKISPQKEGYLELLLNYFGYSYIQDTNDGCCIFSNKITQRIEENHVDSPHS